MVKNTVMKTKKTKKKLPNINLKYINLEKALWVRIKMDTMCKQVEIKKKSITFDMLGY